jgi:hypothetical protein
MIFPRSRLPRWLNILLVVALLWAPLSGHVHGSESGCSFKLGVQATF